MRIIKFDHITYVEEKKNEQRVLEHFTKMYPLKWMEKGMKNIESKKTFLENKQNLHDLYFFESSFFSTELILYTTTGKKTDIVLKENTIYGHYLDGNAVKACLEFIGAKCIRYDEDVLEYNLRGIFDRNDIVLHLKKADKIKTVNLDCRGYSCPTILVDELQGVENENVFVITKPEIMWVHGKLLKISFMKCTGMNMVIELISPVRSKDEDN